MAHNPLLAAHKAWIGYLQPVGLVVSPHALLAAQAVVSESVSEPQQRLRSLPRPLSFTSVATEVLGWRTSDLTGNSIPLPEHLAHPLPEYGEILRPTFAVANNSSNNNSGNPWLLLILEVPPNTDLDAPPTTSSHGWHAPPQAKFERLLRETGVPIGLLHNGSLLRLVYAPRGETSGHLTFPLEFLSTFAGRQSLAALLMLLGADRLFSESDDRRLPALLAESRKYQNEVSTRLAEQVLGALLELLRGFQAADEAAHGELLRSLAQDDPQHIYGGLLTVLLRLVFLLYAEDRGLMPGDPTWTNNYSVTHLYLQLREDASLYPDTIDQRFGAWPALLSLFRLIYTGATHDRLHLPAREGRLFNPDSYPFLEGRTRNEAWQPGRSLAAPRVPDGVLWRVLQALLLLDGERLSYRSLDVEQIGSVYESMMGFQLERAHGPSIALRPQHVVIDLAQLLLQKPESRAKFLKESAHCDITGPSLAALKAAKTPDEALAAVGRKQSHRTPTIVPAGSLYLQPGEERRKSGSHYTPRSLTEPIVRTTLQPILQALGPNPTPTQLLDVKLCDPAMGSGAFLVEAARQLGDHLRQSWDFYRSTPPIPPDEDPDLHARRLVTQRCLYGVDKNPFAVDLAKLSLWLVTLAKDHAFTFLDHALKHGDSLVGLNKSQIAEFRWDQETRLPGPLFEHFKKQVGKATTLRRELALLGDEQDAAKRSTLRDADDAVREAKLIGDAVISAYFSEDNDKKRHRRREELYKETVQPAQKGDPKALARLEQLRSELRSGDRPVSPFHWEIEFPEVFDRDNPGFDCVTGNPPFVGGTMISTSTSGGYLALLKLSYPESGNRMDLVAYFFRRGFDLLRSGGTLGLIGTNTIAQGDTRSGGLGYICTHGGSIFDATKRLKWPGAAAVVVSVVHVAKQTTPPSPLLLDGRSVARITAFLFDSGGDRAPQVLAANREKVFTGAKPYGDGFIFDDDNLKTSSIAEMESLISTNPANKERIFPYIGGEEVNTHPHQQHHRFIINFETMTEAEAGNWPDLLTIARNKVMPERKSKAADVAAWPWWQFWRSRAELASHLKKLDRVLVNSQVSARHAIAFQPTDRVFSHALNIFIFSSFAAFTALQSRVHELWARFFGSSLEDRLRYTPSDCFETFPFPENWQQSQPLEQVGERYYNFRAELMVRNNEGLTTTYNRFHDPDERSPDILKLRELHAEMDHAVLTAYGWTDLADRATSTFRLDYEDDDDPTDDAPIRARTKKKPWRYRWPQDLHDEVLARLLDLNQQRAEQERLTGTTTTKSPSKKTTKKTTKKSPTKKSPTTQSTLPHTPTPEDT